MSSTSGGKSGGMKAMAYGESSTQAKPLYYFKANQPNGIPLG
jgi:hypothetical protein